MCILLCSACLCLCCVLFFVWIGATVFVCGMYQKKRKKEKSLPLTCGAHFSVQLKQKLGIIPHLPSIPAKDFDYDYVGLMTVAEGLRVAVMQQG